MKTLLLKGREIVALGFPKGNIIQTIIRIISENYTDTQKEYVLNLLRTIMRNPTKFKNHETYGEIAYELMAIKANLTSNRIGARAPEVNEGIVYGAPTTYNEENEE